MQIVLTHSEKHLPIIFYNHRCNLKFDCPGGTDEQECDQLCAPRGMFKCKQQTKCLHRDKICNSVEDCNDGSDEFPEACLLGKLNKIKVHCGDELAF